MDAMATLKRVVKTLEGANDAEFEELLDLADKAMDRICQSSESIEDMDLAIKFYYEARNILQDTLENLQELKEKYDEDTDKISGR